MEKDKKRSVVAGVVILGTFAAIIAWMKARVTPPVAPPIELVNAD